MPARPFVNSVLKALDPDVIERLHLRPVTFELMHEIEYPGQPVENLYFVEEGMASITVTFENGDQVEAGMFGFESVIGISALMGTKHSLNRIYTQIPGRGFRCSFEDAQNEFRRSGQFHNLALRYVQAQLLQSMQSTACNAKHPVEARLAKWLLLCADRVHQNTFDISHEFLSEMLGNTRSSVTRACGEFKEEGLMEYSRRHVRLLDVPGLERRACECYRQIKNHLDNITEFDTGTK